MKNLGNAALTICFLSLFVFGQSKEPFHQEWLDKDLANIDVLAKLLPVEKKSLESIKEAFEGTTDQNLHSSHYIDPSDDYGFGFKEFQLGSPGGYCHVFVKGFVLNSEYAVVKYGVDCSSSQWKIIRPKLLKRWNQNTESKITEGETSLFHEEVYEDVIEDYKKEVSRDLGEIERVDVPNNLKENYRFLMSPTQNAVVGFGGCDVAGVVPAGKNSIDELVAARRIDLLENVLRGFNPGGRVYALNALTELKNSGVNLRKGTLETMEKVLDLKIQIEICEGCIHSDHTAREILKRFRK